MAEITTAYRNNDQETVEGRIEEQWEVPVYGGDRPMERGLLRTVYDHLLVVWRWKGSRQWRVDEER
jgi:hypothetical protein